MSPVSLVIGGQFHLHHHTPRGAAGTSFRQTFPPFRTPDFPSNLTEQLGYSRQGNLKIIDERIMALAHATVMSR